MKDRIRQIRRQFSLTQGKFARQIGKTPGFISNVETGRVGVSEKTIRKICQTFDVNEEWLRNGTGDMFTTNERKTAPDTQGIGARIKVIRKREGLSQKQFGERTGYHKNQVYNVEKGRSIPSEALVAQVCREFRVSMDWVMSGKGDPAAVSDGIDEQLIGWLRDNPDVVRELRLRSGLD